MVSAPQQIKVEVDSPASVAKGILHITDKENMPK